MNNGTSGMAGMDGEILLAHCIKASSLTIWFWLNGIPSTFLCWRPNAWFDGIWRCGFGKIIYFIWGQEDGPSWWDWCKMRRRGRRGKKRKPQSSLFSPTMWEHSEKAVNREESSHQKLSMLAPRSRTSRLQHCKKINFCCSQSRVFCYGSPSKLRRWASLPQT